MGYIDVRSLVEDRTKATVDALSLLRGALDVLVKEFSYEAPGEKESVVYTFRHKPSSISAESITLLCNGKSHGNGTYVRFDSIRGYVVYDGAVEQFHATYELDEALGAIVEHLLCWISADAELKSKPPEVEPG